MQKCLENHDVDLQTSTQTTKIRKAEEELG